MLKIFARPPPPAPEPKVGFVSTSDALVLAGILKMEMQSAKEMADFDPSWLAHAQVLERVIPVLEQSEIIVIE